MSLGIRRWVRSRYRDVTGANALATMALTLPSGQIRLEEARALGALVSGLTAPGPIIEIGTLFAWSTRVMILFKSAERPLITVDNYGWNPLGLNPELHRRCTTQCLDEAISSHNVQLLSQDKSVFYREYHGPAPALVFLDAQHSYEETRKDITWARSAGAGIICVHDYCPEHPGVVHAVNEAGGTRLLVQSLAVL